ncbi:MAG: CBS domain-containing protein [Deinococcota bacterium]
MEQPSIELIVGHQQPDFDALASTVLARLLHPRAKAVVVGKAQGEVRDFIHLYRDALRLDDSDSINLDAVTSLIMVDTAVPARLGRFAVLAETLPVTVYDHHPKQPDDVVAVAGVHRNVGAAVTILVQMLAAQKIAIPPELATLGLLGIHTDTGHLCYPQTHADDHRAAAYLLACGASLETVQQFSQDSYSLEKRALFVELIASAKVSHLPVGDVVIATAQRDDYIADIAPLANELLTLHDAEAALVIIRMAGKTLIVARATSSVDVGSILQTHFGGGGHAGAAFASTERAVDDVTATLLDALAARVPAGRLAKDIMSMPVKTIAQDATVREAGGLLERYGHNGLPVLASGQLVGMISSRDIARALRHDLGHAPVSSIMIREVITASETTSIDDLEDLIMEHNIGRVPIVHTYENKPTDLVGIVTRSDLIAQMHDQHLSQRVHLPQTTKSSEVASSGDRAALAETVLSRLPGGLMNVIDGAVTTVSSLMHQSEAHQPDTTALYLVGGTVRDALLARSSDDLDFVLEHGDVPVFTQALAKVLRGDVSCHDTFGTCTIRLSNGLMVDVASARDEYYLHPGALPSIITSNLPRDLARRDFTVNTLALRLFPEPRIIIDRHAALKDLDAKVLRTLHPLSFVEDPTRIVRAARLAARLGFRVSAATREQMQHALSADVLAQVSDARRMHELHLVCAERQVLPVLDVLIKVDALNAMYNITLTDDLREIIRQLDIAHLQGDDWLLNTQPADANIAKPLADASATKTDAVDSSVTADAVTAENLDASFTESYLLTLMLGQGEVTAERWTKKRLEHQKHLMTALNHPSFDDDSYHALSAAARRVLIAARPDWESQARSAQHVPPRRKLRGRDVLELGLERGPAVGEILAAVDAARRRGDVTTYEDEYNLAKKLVMVRTNTQQPQQSGETAST